LAQRGHGADLDRPRLRAAVTWLRHQLALRDARIKTRSRMRLDQPLVLQPLVRLQYRGDADSALQAERSYRWQLVADPQGSCLDLLCDGTAQLEISGRMRLGLALHAASTIPYRLLRFWSVPVQIGYDPLATMRP